MGSMQTRTWRRGVLLFKLLFACCLMLLPSRAAHAAEQSVSISLPVKQTFVQTSNATDVDQMFSYTLVALEAENPMPIGSRAGIYAFTIDGTSSSSVGPITYTEAGVYNYRIGIDANEKMPGYTYDSKVYTVSVHVKNMDGKLTTEAIAKKDTVHKVNTIEFENTYHPTAADRMLMVDPPVKKTVAGNPPRDAVFTFTLTAQKATFPMPQGSVNGVKTMTIVGSGEEDFGTWEYTEAGTYFYTVAEVNTGESGYFYDTAVYTITDVVKDVDGQLVLDRVVTNAANKPVSSYTYINKYSPSGGGGIIGPKTGDDARSTPYILAIAVASAIAMGCVYGLWKCKKDDASNI